jgi:hypothetical protein
VFKEELDGREFAERESEIAGYGDDIEDIDYYL